MIPRSMIHVLWAEREEGERGVSLWVQYVLIQVVLSWKWATRQHWHHTYQLMTLSWPREGEGERESILTRANIHYLFFITRLRPIN